MAAISGAAKPEAPDYKSVVVSKLLALGNPDLTDFQIQFIAETMACIVVEQAAPYLDMGMTLRCSATGDSGDIFEISAIEKLRERAIKLFIEDFKEGDPPYQFLYTFLTILDTCSGLKDKTQLANLAPDFLLMCSLEWQDKELFLILDIKHGPDKATKKIPVKA